MVRDNSQGTVNQVQELHVKRYPESTVYHGSDPGCVWWGRCQEEAQVGNCSCQVPEAVAAAVGKMQCCYILGEVVLLLSHVGAERLPCNMQFVVLEL